MTKLYGPHKCPRCDGEDYYGRWLFRDEEGPALCPNHKEDEKVELVPCRGAKVDRRA